MYRLSCCGLGANPGIEALGVFHLASTAVAVAGTEVEVEPRTGIREHPFTEDQEPLTQGEGA